MQIGIVGLGLIGGSLGLEFVRQGHQVWGVSRQPQTCQQAEARHVVHKASTDLFSLAIPTLDIVFVCTPIGLTLPTIEQLSQILLPSVVITDVASVKGAIVPLASQLWPLFVGGHPMAGTEQQGIQAAQMDLFQNRAYVLTPLPTTPPSAVDCLAGLISHLGSRLVVCDPFSHDAAVAQISHLPVMLSACLLSSAQGMPEERRKLAQQLASSGFRDTSRVGGGNPELGLAMAQYNQPALLAALRDYQTHLQYLTTCLEQGEWGSLSDLLTSAQQSRPDWIDPHKGKES
ncbi:MAG: prephenate/arogenate dehydrogenase [Cyanobacteriota bacterium]|nr:prephenate/arogenate dehydrogenase [Cyanobacteriota bacterium]